MEFPTGASTKNNDAVVLAAPETNTFKMKWKGRKEEKMIIESFLDMS